MDESDIYQLEATLTATKEAGKTYLQAALTKFLLNWVGLLFIYLICLSFFPFFKWIFPLFLLLIMYSLYHIYRQNRLLRQKIKEIEGLIAEIKEE